MATIKSQMVLNDGMSVVLKKITSALDTTLSSFEMVQRASGSAVDVANIEAARAQLADASRAVDDMADNYRRAAQEEERLNDSINRGASAMDGMVTKVVSLVGAYMSLSAIKNLATTSMDAANTQINAQVQLRTVLENMGAMDSYEALTNEVSGNELENDLTLNTAGALDNYDTFAAEVTGNTLEAELVVQADNSQALTAYDAIVQKAADIQGNGIYGDEIMIAGAAEFATYFEDANAILSMMDTLTDYAMGMSGGGPLQVVGVQAEGEGAAVHQAHVHNGAEDAGVHAGHVAPGEGDEVLVEPLGLIGRGGVGEGGAVALPAVGEERELADHEHLASHVGQAQIGLAALVLEHAHLANLLPEPFRLGLVVAVAHAQKDQVPAPDATDDVPFHAHAGFAHTLDNSSHRDSFRGRRSLRDGMRVVSRFFIEQRPSRVNAREPASGEGEWFT